MFVELPVWSPIKWDLQQRRLRGGSVLGVSCPLVFPQEGSDLGLGRGDIVRGVATLGPVRLSERTVYACVDAPFPFPEIRLVCSIPRRSSGKFSFSCLGRWLACIPQRLVVALLRKVPAQVRFTAYCFPGISGHVGSGGQASSAGLGSGHDRGLIFYL